MEGLGERRPTQLSGGQQQRVALARALVVEPRVLLLDEPLSNLDARLRDEMREEVRRLHQETGLTMVYVTHDQKEALSLADRLAVMDRGRIVQVGNPQAVYDSPASRFIAGFLGDCNFLPGVVRASQCHKIEVETAAGTLVGTLPLGLPQPGAPLLPLENSRVVCAIRPHAFQIGETLADAEETSPLDLRLDADMAISNRIPCTVQKVTFQGETLQVHLLAAGETPLLLVSLPQAAGALKPGQAVTLAVPSDQVLVLPEVV
jgi:ABC-type Fe3+/spermidine/putrescine transport system ATPase subunit